MGHRLAILPVAILAAAATTCWGCGGPDELEPEMHHIACSFDPEYYLSRSQAPLHDSWFCGDATDMSVINAVSRHGCHWDLLTCNSCPNPVLGSICAEHCLPRVATSDKECLAIFLGEDDT